MSQAITLIKIGGNVIDQLAMTTLVLQQVAQFTQVGRQVVLVHGGGKLATRLAEQLNIPQTLVDGRRITDAATLDIATMVYAGTINKNLVAQLQALGTNAIGLTGADANTITATLRPKNPIDFGFVGDVTPSGVNIKSLTALLQAGLTPVFCSLTHDGQGQLLNTNADTLAQVLAIALAQVAQVELLYLFEKKGVLRNQEDEESLIASISPTLAEELIVAGVITAGMIPKIRNATYAVSQGVHQVVIGSPAHLPAILAGHELACTRIYAQ